MSAKAEVEWKLALTAAEYRRLVKSLGHGEGTRRTRNRYWETSDRRLRLLGCGLRLRECAGRAPVLTFKYSLKKEVKSVAGVHRRGEVECRITPLTARRLRAGTLSPLALRNAVAARGRQVLGNVLLSPLGDLNLERRLFHWNDFLLEVDRFTVHGTTYYEVEVEHRNPTAVARQLRPFFRALGLRWTPKSRTKVSYLYGA